MYNNKQKVEKKTLQQQISGLFKYILLKLLGFFTFPHKIAKKYSKYNKEIGEMYHEIRDSNLARLKARNAKLLNLCIYLPIFLGFIASAISIYSHRNDFSLYHKKITTPIYAKSFPEKIKTISKRISYAVFEIPLNKFDYIFFFGGYFFAFFGAGFLSLNPAFAQEYIMREKFKALKLINENGEPWGLTWTPDALMITSFNNDPLALKANMKFWSTINFPPSNPKIFKNDMNKFIVYKRYELPASVVLEYKGEIEEEEDLDNKIEEQNDGRD